MPFDFEDCFRKGDVGGERGFDAALAFLSFEEAASALDGDKMNETKPIHSIALSISTRGFVRRNDRRNAIAPMLYVVLCPSSCDLEVQNMCQSQGVQM